MKAQLFFLAAIFASIALTLTALGILIAVLGWQVLFVLGAALFLFVIASLIRDALRTKPQTRSF